MSTKTAQVALITGGGSGIGFEISRQLGKPLFCILRPVCTVYRPADRVGVLRLLYHRITVLARHLRWHVRIK